MNSSILYRDSESYTEFDASVLHDLRIDAIIDAIAGTGGAGELRRTYRRKPDRQEDVLFRLSIMEDLERPPVRAAALTFLERHNTFMLALGHSRSMSQPQARQKWFLDAAELYCRCLLELNDSLAGAGLRSEGLLRFHSHLAAYLDSAAFRALHADTTACCRRLGAIRYALWIDLDSNTVEVSRDDGGSDFLGDLHRTFARYGCSASGRDITALPGVNMSKLELLILQSLDGICGGLFETLACFYEKHPSFENGMIDAFRDELSFYCCYIRCMEKFKKAGVPFAYPVFTGEKSMQIREGYDLSLAEQTLDGGTAVTGNDFTMTGDEKHFVITGPNQGGKTTYACMLGQIVYFTMMGLPSPCRSLSAYFPRNIYTLFAREEDISTNYGRLKDELMGLRQIFNRPLGDSVIILNEILTSTALWDATRIGRRLLHDLTGRDCLCLFVTHIEELAGVNPRIVSLYARAEDDHGRRVYRVDRRAAPAAAYSSTLMDRYRLYDTDIKERVR